MEKEITLEEYLKRIKELLESTKENISNFKATLTELINSENPVSILERVNSSEAAHYLANETSKYFLLLKDYFAAQIDKENKYYFEFKVDNSFFVGFKPKKEKQQEKGLSSLYT